MCVRGWSEGGLGGVKILKSWFGKGMENIGRRLSGFNVGAYGMPSWSVERDANAFLQVA
jgi:hypothetical protein